MSDDGPPPESPASDQLSRILVECLNRLEAGQPVSAAEVAAEHPEYRAEIEAFLADYSGLHQLVGLLDQCGAGLKPVEKLLPPAGRFAGYELLGVLGRGGMAVVYEARPPQSDRTVALKMVELPASAVTLRFRLEAQLAATLDHPNVVPIYDVGECDGRPFYTMRLYEGGTLARALAGGRWAGPGRFRRAAEVTAAVARAVQYAHDQGIVHRDLKPANILLDADGRPHVADFGLARRVTDPRITASGALVGTPAYMPPEQAAGHTSGDRAADVYSLGAILYELLAGRPLRRAETSIKVILEAIECDPVRPRLIDPAIPRDLETICLRCLEYDPKKRYPAAAALADDLGRWQAGEPVLARPARVSERLARWARRHPTTVGVVGAVVAVALAALWAGTLAVQRVRTASAEARVRVEADAREQVERQHYFRAVTLAAREREAGNPDRAEQLLALCPPARRGWEWDYLRRQPVAPAALLGTTSHLFAVAVRADGGRVVVGGSDGSVHVWDVDRGSSVRRATHAGKQVRGLAFAPDGTRFASAGWDGRVVLWDARTVEPVRAWACDATVSPSGTFAVAFSLDGRVLAASMGHDIRRWEVAGGAPLPPLVGHQKAIRRVAFHPDGGELAAVDDGGRLKVWDLNDARPRLDVQAHPHLAFDLGYSPDGRRLVTAGGQFYMHGDAGEVRVWDAADGTRLHEFGTNTGAFYTAAFTPDATRVVAGGEDGRVRVWDAASGEEVLSLRGHAEAVWGLAFSGDGRRMYSAGGDHRVRLWDATPVADADPAATPGGHESRVTAVAYSPDGAVLVSAGMDGRVHVRDPDTGAAVRSLPPLRGHVHALAVSPDGSRLAGAVWRRPDDPAGDAGVVVWDTRTWGTVARPGPERHGALGVAFSPDGRLLATTNDHSVAVMDTATWAVVWHEPHTSLVTAVAFGGGELAYSDADGVVTFRDPWTGRPRPGSLSAHPGRVRGMAYSPDQTRLATAGTDGGVRVWDVPTRTPVAAAAGHVGGAHAVAFTPDGRRLVSGGSDGVVRAWDAGTGRELVAFAGHADAVHAVAVHPSGARLASGGRDRSVRLWRLGPE